VRGYAATLAAGGVGVALLALTVIGTAAAGLTVPDLLELYIVTNLAIGVAMLGSGIAIALGARGNAVGILFRIGGLGHLASAAGYVLAILGDGAGWPELVVRALMSVFLAGWLLGLGGPFVLALLLFPDGRLVSPRWRPVAIGMLALCVVQLVVTLVDATPPTGPVTATSLLAVVPLPEDVILVLGIVVTGSIAVSLAALIVRYIRGDDALERRLLWLILAVLVALVVNLQRWLTGDGPVVLLLAFLLVPVAMAIAIVRPQLFDVRLVVSRAITYGVLVVLVVGLYVGLVAGVSLLVPDDADRVVAIGAALVVALAFAPLRSLLQSLLTRAFYGSRRDPARTASLLGPELGADAEVGELLERVRTALRLRGLELRLDDAEHARAGDTVGPTGDVAVAAGAVLVAGLRAGESRLHTDDERSLALVGAPLALLARTRVLAGQLRDARASTVEARERERAVLHRDLHDGLGPTLTSAAYRADAARNLVARDAARAGELLDAARDDVRAALAEVRRVVYGLRPLELEEHGLEGALRRRLASGGRLTLSLEVEGDLAALSPAAELAAYRIALEAITNAERHSTGTRGGVVLRVGAQMLVEVTDDGVAPPDVVEGVGLASMRDRAEELGGRLSAGPAEGAGWRVTAVLPLA
jgi:two-component system NarL family sensor kinase